MGKKESKLLNEQNKLLKSLVTGIKEVIDGKIKPFK